MSGFVSLGNVLALLATYDDLAARFAMLQQEHMDCGDRNVTRPNRNLGETL